MAANPADPPPAKPLPPSGAAPTETAPTEAAPPETPPSDAADPRRFNGPNEGLADGRKSEDDLLSRPRQDGWNSNT